MDSVTYVISEAYLKKTKKTYLYMAVSMPLAIIGITLLRPEPSSWRLMWGFLLGLTLFIELEILVVGRMMLSKIRRNQLIVGDTQLQRISGKLEKSILYSELRGLLVRREKNGSIRFIDLQLPDKRITLYGFEGMEEIFAALTAHTSGIPLKEKTYRHNYDSLLSYTVIFIVALAVLLGVGQLTSFPISSLYLLGFGAWFIFWKPVSRTQGQRFRWVELLLGILMVGGNLVTLIAALLP